MHKASVVDGPVRHVRLTPKSGEVTWRGIILGGVHGDEWPARLSPSMAVRCLTYSNLFDRSLAPGIAAGEVLVVHDAHPSACAVGMRDGEFEGDLNCSWPGSTDPRGQKYSSDQSRRRASELAEWMLAAEPSSIVGLHAHRGSWLVYGTAATADRALGMPHEVREDTDLGLASWGLRNGIPAVDLEAPSPDRDLEAVAAKQAESALRLLASLSGR